MVKVQGHIGVLLAILSPRVVSRVWNGLSRLSTPTFKSLRRSGDSPDGARGANIWITLTGQRSLTVGLDVSYPEASSHL